jgi:hypothetical protein
MMMTMMMMEKQSIHEPDDRRQCSSMAGRERFS